MLATILDDFWFWFSGAGPILIIAAIFIVAYAIGAIQVAGAALYRKLTR